MSESDYEYFNRKASSCPARRETLSGKKICRISSEECNINYCFFIFLLNEVAERHNRSL